VTTLVAVIPASNKAEINKVEHNWIIQYIFGYLIIVDSGP
jgi:hypothetical protein